jgi:dipeptidase E
MPKKNIIILAGVDSTDNIPALKHIKTKYPSFKNLCYIPAEAEDSEYEIKSAKKHLSRFLGLKSFDSILLEFEKSFEVKAKIAKSQILFLGGGNTFNLYDNIKKHRLKKILKEHLKSGKLIVGLSAGGIVLGPSLMMACYPSKDADECSKLRSDFSALNLVDFEVCPHFKSSKNMIKELSVYSSLSKSVLYALKDGDFVAFGGDSIHFHGGVSVFSRGELLNLK